MLTGIRAGISFTKLLPLARRRSFVESGKPLPSIATFISSRPADDVRVYLTKATRLLRRSGSGMADSGEQTPVAGGEPVVKTAKQLKKDAKKKEKMEKFQQKQAKMAGQQNNSGSEVYGDMRELERERGYV